MALLGLAGMIVAERLWEFVGARVLLGLGAGSVGPAVGASRDARSGARGEALGFVGVSRSADSCSGPCWRRCSTALGVASAFIALMVLLLAVAALR